MGFKSWKHSRVPTYYSKSQSPFKRQTPPWCLEELLATRKEGKEENQSKSRVVEEVYLLGKNPELLAKLSDVKKCACRNKWLSSSRVVEAHKDCTTHFCKVQLFG
jgi:myo-inositol catabolism protein IolC